MTLADDLDRDSPLPLWAQLYELLSSRLGQGDFSEDFPSELELASSYGVSRNTVREAMRRLRQEGAVVSARGRRPRVATSLIEQPLGAIYSLYAAVEAAGLTQQSVVLTCDTRRDPLVASQLELEPAAPLFFLERLRLAGEEPLALDRVWLPQEIGALIQAADFSHTALYTELHARAGVRVTSGSERVRAVVPDATDRALLELEDDGAALSITRLARDEYRALEWRVTLIRGDRFSLVADFSARTGHPLDASAMTVETPEE